MSRDSPLLASSLRCPEDALTLRKKVFWEHWHGSGMDREASGLVLLKARAPRLDPEGVGKLSGMLARVRQEKWLKRFSEAPPEDLAVLHSRSCARHLAATLPSIHVLLQCIVEMRENPPEGLQCVPGPKTLLYYFPRDPELQALGIPLPRSTRTVGKILRQQGCILDDPTRHHHPLELRQPLDEIQMD